MGNEKENGKEKGINRKGKIAIYIRKDHYEELKRISSITGIPLPTLVGLALDLHILEKTFGVRLDEIPKKFSTNDPAHS